MSKSEGQVLDFEKICRLCLLEKRSMSAIFSKKKSDKKVPLPVRIMSCASLELYEGDGLPASICSKCLLSVNQSYAFREQCEQADTTLRQYAQRMNEASEEASTNREPGERIANDSLERIEDIGNNNEECEDGEEKDLERRNESDSRIIHECQGDGRNLGAFNFGNVAMFSSSEHDLTTDVSRGTEDVMSDVGSKDFKKSTENKVNSAKTKSMSFKVEFMEVSIEKKRDSRESENVEPMEEVSDEIGNVEDGRDGGFEIDEDVCQEQMIVQESENNVDKKPERTFDYPALRALSTEKAEKVVVIADVDTINAKFPSDLEDEDGDHRETGLNSSEDEDSLTKAKTQNWYKQSYRTKKDLKLNQPYKSSKREVKNNSKSNFGNRKHLELLQNLMKNKNIVVQRRAVCGSTELLTGRSLANKSLRRRRDMSFPNEFKIAQLWKEWEEVNKRIPQVARNSRPKLESSLAISRANDTCSDGAKDEMGKSVKKVTPPEVVFGEGAEHIRSGDGGKMKWKNGKDTVYCKDCRIFLLRSSYNNHIKFVHEKVRKYLCQTCGYAACTGTILRQHVQAVHVGYSFFCDQCPKKFNLMKRLRKHIELQHSGKPIERNHICQYCGMAFVKPGCLKRHLRSHTQETPYQCQYCQRRFKYRWPKVQHERLHTGEKPYKCSFCEERFTQNCVRKAHEYKKHGNEEFKPKNRIRKEENLSNEILKVEKVDSEASSRGSFNSGSESS